MLSGYICYTVKSCVKMDRHAKKNPSLCVNFFSRVCWIFSQLITEQASFTLPRNAEIEGKCGTTESEIHISWKNKAYTLRIYFSKVGEKKRHGTRESRTYCMISSWIIFREYEAAHTIYCHLESSSVLSDFTKFKPDFGFLSFELNAVTNHVAGSWHHVINALN